MYQILYGTVAGISGSVFTYTGSAELTAAGKLTFSYLNGSGVRTGLNTDCKGKFDLILGRANANGGPVSLPLHMNSLKVAGAEFKANTTFVATVTCADVDDIGDITLLITKCGMPFNERATWTANFHITTEMTGAQIATRLAALVNANTQAHDIVATVASNVVTLTAQKSGVEYDVKATDLLSGATVAVTTHGKEGRGLDPKRLAVIASKAAADAGIEYTFQDGAELLYPTYPFNPANQAALTGSYDMLVIGCGEPRDFKTTEETVHQVVTIIAPHVTGTGSQMLKGVYDNLVYCGAVGGGFVLEAASL